MTGTCSVLAHGLCSPGLLHFPTAWKRRSQGMVPPNQELGLATSIDNQVNSRQTCSQGNLIWDIPEVRESSQLILACGNLQLKTHQYTLHVSGDGKGELLFPGEHSVWLHIACTLL